MYTISVPRRNDNGVPRGVKCITIKFHKSDVSFRTRSGSNYNVAAGYTVHIVCINIAWYRPYQRYFCSGMTIKIVLSFMITLCSYEFYTYFLFKIFTAF